jgi:6-phosphogluconolactonase
MTGKNFELLSFADADDLARAAAEAWLGEIESAIGAGQTHCAALSGGRIARKFFASTAAQAKTRDVSFDGVHFFWADERCVPPDDPQSNFKMADTLLFAPLRIARDKIHRLRGEDPPPAAVEQANAELCRIAKKNQKQQPILDIIFLGMGEDGHIASLFPAASAKLIDIPVPFLVVENAPKPPPTRISLSYQAIIAAKNVWILISGAGKAAALRESLSSTGQTPLARVLAARPVKIFSDINEI